ncbi:MAG: hypothetical protein EOO02_12575 [Chitinophagaceae bacterium]|nr:MAG: hypothetical protein EOO02_12575 [Chitinophagaceae bacterium]
MYRGNLDSGKVSQYQRAVTPTIETSNTPNTSNIPSNITASPSIASGNGIRSKVLSYNPPPSRSNLTRNSAQMLSATATSTPTSTNIGMYRNAYSTNGTDMSVQGMKSTHRNSIKGSEVASLQEQLAAMTSVPRYDLVPLADEIPSDGIIFAKVRYNPLTNAHPTLSPDTLVVFRTAEERLRNPERLNLDRRQLEFCPLLEQEQRLRLLNYQNNNIKYITNLENLPNLIFLDLYNNKIITLEGPLCQVRGLRVLMAGKNRINRITNLTQLKKLDVLDLHSNEIKVIEGLEGLSDLRVLNLAGNKIAMVENLQSLSSLTELNLRRNQITHIYGLHTLPALQRIFLSHNFIQAYVDIQCIFNIQSLIELSLDNNPLVEKEGAGYRYTVLAYLSSLKHLDFYHRGLCQSAQHCWAYLSNASVL